MDKMETKNNTTDKLEAADQAKAKGNNDGLSLLSLMTDKDTSADNAAMMGTKGLRNASKESQHTPGERTGKGGGEGADKVSDVAHGINGDSDSTKERGSKGDRGQKGDSGKEREPSRTSDRTKLPNLQLDIPGPSTGAQQQAERIESTLSREPSRSQREPKGDAKQNSNSPSLDVKPANAPRPADKKPALDGSFTPDLPPTEKLKA